MYKDRVPVKFTKASSTLNDVMHLFFHEVVLILRLIKLMLSISLEKNTTMNKKCNYIQTDKKLRLPSWTLIVVAC
jgi:hypothetical protein